MALPGSLGQNINRQFTDDNGVPLADGFLVFKIAGLSTLKNVYTTAALNVAWTSPLPLDSAGRATYYMAPGGYDITVYNASMVQQYVVEDVEDVGQTFLATLGWQFAQGSQSVATGYTVLSTDYFVTINAGAGGNVNLPPAADRSDTSGNAPPLVLKNMGANAVTITPDGTETIDGVTGTYTIPAAASPNFPAITLYSDGISNYWIAASHGL